MVMLPIKKALCSHSCFAIRQTHHATSPSPLGHRAHRVEAGERSYVERISDAEEANTENYFTSGYPATAIKESNRQS